MLKKLVLIFLLIPFSLFSQTDLELITRKANELLASKDFEQARYHWSLAKNIDSTNQSYYDYKIFLVDSIDIENKGGVRKLTLGDSSMFAGNNGLALRYFTDNWGIAKNYANYRINHILQTDPSAKGKWLAILSKLSPNSPYVDTNKLDTIYQIEIPDTKPTFHLKDSIHYKTILDSLIRTKNFFVANYVIREHIYDYGKRELFEIDLKRVHLIQQKSIMASDQSAALKLERIERLESEEKPNIKKIKEILESITIENLESKALIAKVVEKRKIYVEK